MKCSTEVGEDGPKTLSLTGRPAGLPVQSIRYSAGNPLDTSRSPSRRLDQAGSIVNETATQIVRITDRARGRDRRIQRLPKKLYRNNDREDRRLVSFSRICSLDWSTLTGRYTEPVPQSKALFTCPNASQAQRVRSHRGATARSAPTPLPRYGGQGGSRISLRGGRPPHT